MEEVPQGRKRKFAQAKKRWKTLPLRRRPIKNICHNLILSSKPIATPRKKGRRDPWPAGFNIPRHMKNFDIANRKRIKKKIILIFVSVEETNSSTKCKQNVSEGSPHRERSHYSTVVEQRMTVELLCWRGPVGKTS